MKKKRFFRKIFWTILITFLMLNVVAYFHAHKFTHFSENRTSKTKTPKELSAFEKAKTILFGIKNPRPENTEKPDYIFETIRLQSNKIIECWHIKTDSSKGSVILFHGYGGNKSSMLDKAEQFLQLQYDVLLVDFMGSGGSEGNQTTIGYKEAEEVKTCYEYLIHKGEKKVFLFGTSMGAVAILRAIHKNYVNPSGIIIECPFGTMYSTTCNRFKNMGLPAFPMADLLIFWGGIQNGFWAFSHKPINYAKNVSCPTLLLYGEKDDRVSRKEIDEVFENLKGIKTLKTYSEAGHENYFIKYKSDWVSDVSYFLNAVY